MPHLDASLARDLQAVNHGVPEELLEDLVSKGREMFSLPKAQKTKFKVHTFCVTHHTSSALEEFRLDCSTLAA